ATFRGGPIVTAGGLMFRNSSDGRIEAFDAGVGKLLWQFQTGTRATSSGSGSPATYEVDGEQFIVASMDAALWGFKLGGTIPPTSATEQATARTDDDLVAPVEDT